MEGKIIYKLQYISIVEQRDIAETQIDTIRNNYWQEVYFLDIGSKCEEV